MLSISKMTCSRHLLCGLSNRGAIMSVRMAQYTGSRLRVQDFTARGVKSKGFFYELGILFSKEKRAERAKKLQEEVNRGRFYELNELKSTGGKLFEGSEKLLAAASAKMFPSIDGVQLLGQNQNSASLLRGKVTLVTVCLRYSRRLPWSNYVSEMIVDREIARPMAISWTKPFVEKFGGDVHVQVLNIFFIEGMLYKMMQGLMVSLMKRQVPAESWKSSFVAFNKIEAVRQELDMKNRLVGYVFLIDQEGRIRWKGVGYAQHHEMKSLLECCAQLSRLY